MKHITCLVLAFLLVGCENEHEITETAPLWEQHVVEVGACTPQVVAWDRTVSSRCVVKMNDGEVKTVLAPVMVGSRFITCPERTNNIDNQRCVIWYGARHNWKAM